MTAHLYACAGAKERYCNLGLSISFTKVEETDLTSDPQELYIEARRAKTRIIPLLC